MVPGGIGTYEEFFEILTLKSLGRIDRPIVLYNIQGYETLTVKEIVTKIHHALGKEVPDGCFGSVQRADAGMKYLALDGTKLKNAIGFEAQKSIEESLKEY